MGSFLAKLADWIPILFIITLLAGWTHSLVKPFNHVKQLDYIAKCRQDHVSDMMMVNRDGKGLRWVFIMFSEKSVNKIREEGLNAIQYGLVKTQ